MCPLSNAPSEESTPCCNIMQPAHQPAELESRDSYFTNAMQKIEHLYKQTDSTPVVLLCHSMGCKMGHYLLNFVLHKLGEADGQTWIDEYVKMLSYRVTDVLLRDHSTPIFGCF